MWCCPARKYTLGAALAKTKLKFTFQLCFGQCFFDGLLPFWLCLHNFGNKFLFWQPYFFLLSQEVILFIAVTQGQQHNTFQAQFF